MMNPYDLSMTMNRRAGIVLRTAWRNRRIGSVEELRQMSDAELLALPGIGPVGVAALRKEIGGPDFVYVPCPHCHGTGKQRA